MPVTLTFASVSTDLSIASDALVQNNRAQDQDVAKTILFIGEKASLTAENAIPLSALSLPSDFIEPIANDVTQSITTYVNGKTVIAATFSEKRSRALGPVRGDEIHKVVLEKAAGKNNIILVVRLANNDQVLTASLAIARAFPLFSRKKEPSTDRSVTVYFVLAESPKSVTTTLTKTIIASTGSSKTTTTTTTTTTKKTSPKTSTDTTKIQIVADAVRNAANLVDTPPNELNPTTYVEIVRALHKEKLESAGVTLTVIQGHELEERGFGGIWNVGKASENVPALIVLSHVPATAKKSVAWVGKGLTFDAGGLNIKVGGGMTNMKTDMGGSAGILHGFVAAVLNGVNTNFALHAVLCVAENSVDSRSFRPDDIITAYSGRTVEVVDTDAEGRLCLMDGVAYASKDLNADVVVDMATLTGSQAFATGLRHGGFITNNVDFEREVVEAGKASGDLVFPMLYCPEYQGPNSIMPSVVGDMVNYPKGGSMDAPSSAAGLFVGAHLVPEEKWTEDGEGLWCHLDMALPSKALGRANVSGDLSVLSAESFAAAKTVLVLGEKPVLTAENALPLAALNLPTDFAAPIADDTTDSITTYVAGKTVTISTFAHQRTRNLPPVRNDAVHDVVSKNAGKDGDLVIVLRLANEQQVLPAALAVARAFPLYVKKQKAAAVRAVSVHIVVNGGVASSTTAQIQVVADAVRDAASLVDTPPNELNPTTYVDIVRAVHKEKLEAAGVTLTVIQGTELRDRGFGGIWNVGKASENLPALVILSHVPAEAKKTVAWVGKGITFDTGGLSIKVGGVMSNMKTDMGGSAGVFEGFVATVLNKVNTNFALHAILCIAENSVDERSFRVDDIITAYSGKTVEVNNTDAEGRLCLMDGVAYASKDLNADVIVDMATLTGAQQFATGTKHAGFVSNNAEFETIIYNAGKASGDLAYPMLYAPEFLSAAKVMPSKVADMTNIPAGAGDRGNAPSAGAGLFVLAHMSPEEKWAEDGEGLWCHVDMAFPSNAGGRGTGYGVALFYALAQTLANKYA
ncbi:UNVERIFIED_CONTAM: putative aminopeptidase npepl1 [Siphonaria sp. JEL0065]|nr:putative aminopeptidase npepl1 [Siphonaria sp. JEL0065]